MASPTTGPETKLEIRRMFSAPRAKVFEAWTQREKLEKWMCRDSSAATTRYTAFDVRPGGMNCMEITRPEGTMYNLRVTFQEIQPPEKLVFTWAWERFSASGERNEAPDETLVTVEFIARGNFTEVFLKHENFGTVEQRDRHNSGWNGCFDMLTNTLAA